MMDYYTYNNIETGNARSASFSSSASFTTNNSTFSNNSYGSNNIQQISELNNHYHSTNNNKPNSRVYQYYINNDSSNGYSPLTKENLLLNEYHKQLQTLQLGQDSQTKSQQTKTIPKTLDTGKKLFKTELCTKFILSNECPYNEKCQFAHGLKELQIRQVNSKFKSKLCKNYMKTGYCRYGDRCQFKHGETTHNSNRHLYIKEGKEETVVSPKLKTFNNPNEQWVANVKYIGKVNNW